MLAGGEKRKGGEGGAGPGGGPGPGGGAASTDQYYADQYDQYYRCSALPILAVKVKSLRISTFFVKSFRSLHLMV